MYREYQIVFLFIWVFVYFFFVGFQGYLLLIWSFQYEKKSFGRLVFYKVSLKILVFKILYLWNFFILSKVELYGFCYFLVIDVMIFYILGLFVECF